MSRWTGMIFLPAFACVSAYMLMAHGSPWLGEWNWTFDMVTGTTVLTGPLTAAAGSSIASSERRRALLNDSTLRGWLVPAIAAGRALLIASLTLVSTLVAAVLATASTRDGGPASWWTLPVGPAVLGTCSLVGAIAGHRFPSLTTTVLIGPTVFALGAFGPPTVAALLRNGPVAGSLAGLDYDAGLVAAKLAALTGLAGLIVLAQVPRPIHLRSGIALALFTVLGAAGLVVIATHGTERFRPSHETATECTGSDPSFCVAPSNVRSLDATADRMAPLAQVLVDHGLEVPHRYEQLLPSHIPHAGTGTMIALVSADQPASQAWSAAALNIVRPDPCVSWLDPSQPPPDLAYDAQELLGQWILREAGVEPAPWNQESSRWLAAESDPSQVRWARSTWTALTSCSVDELALPW